MLNNLKPALILISGFKLYFLTIALIIYSVLSFQPDSQLRTVWAQEVNLANLQVAFIGKLLSFVDREGFKQANLKICLEEFNAGPKLQDFSDFSATFSVPVSVVTFKDIKEAESCSIIITNKHLQTEQSNTPLKIVLNSEECSSISHIRLFLEAKKLRFAVNLEQVKIDRFQLSSKLLTLAKIEEC